MAACSSGSSATSTTKPATVTTLAPKPVASTTTTTLSVAQYAAKYSAIVAPANAAITAVNSQVQALGGSATSAQLTSILTPAINAMNTAISQLAAIQWPGNVETDMRALITDNGAVVGDLTALESANALTASSVETKMSEDAGTSKAAADLVHADLGLPQVSS